MEDVIKKAFDILREEVSGPTQEQIFDFLKELAQTEGEKGVQRFMGLLDKALSGETIPLSLISSDLWVASNFLAVIQQIEASERSVMRQWANLLVQKVLTALKENYVG